MQIQTQKLAIIHTNDIHSHFEQMPKIATAIKGIQDGRSREETLILDCGDHLDRMRKETEGSDGIANIEVMNDTGYEAVVMGNNEGLTFPKDVLKKIYTENANFTVLGSNMHELDNGEIPSWLAPYHIVQKGQLKIGLIGVTAQFTRFYELLGWDIRHPYEVTAQLVSQLRPQVDLIVVLSHLGLNHDEAMARTITGIDVILGGHTHHLLEQAIQIGDTYICAAGVYGKHVGLIDLEYDLSERQIQWLEARCIPVSELPDDEHVVSTIRRFELSSAVQLSHNVAYLSKELNNSWNIESQLGNLLASGIRSWTQTDISIVNAGQILNGLHAGAVTRGQLLEICPSPINPCTIWLTGEQIWTALEESLLTEFIEKPIRGFGFRGKVLGTLCVHGAQIEYDPALGSYKKIKNIRLNGQLLEKSREYLVGTIDMFTFGVGYLSLKEGYVEKFYLPEFIRDILRIQLQDEKAVLQCAQSNWLRH